MHHGIFVRLIVCITLILWFFIHKINMLWKFHVIKGTCKFTWPSLNFSKHITHLELVPSDCADSVLSVSLMLPFSSRVLDESDDSTWYFLVSILDNACKAILVRDDYNEKKVSAQWSIKGNNLLHLEIRLHYAGMAIMDFYIQF